MWQKWIGIGRLGKDPELRYTPGGTPVATFSMACSYKFKKGDEMVEDTYWASVVVWGKQGENAAQYLSKGSLALVEGRLQERKWDGQDGAKHSKTEVVASNVKYLDTKKSSSGRTSDNDGGEAAEGDYVPPEGGDLDPF